jgi:hypothetical protein
MSEHLSTDELYLIRNSTRALIDNLNKIGVSPSNIAKYICDKLDGESQMLLRAFNQGIKSGEGVRVEMAADVRLLHALQDQGVDNWEGYSLALEEIRNAEGR